MAVTHPTAVRNGLADYVVDQLDSGSLVIQTSTGGEVATLPFNSTGFGAASSGTATNNPITSDTSAAGGTAAQASLQTATGDEIVACSVTATDGGGDILVANTTISAGQTVSCGSLSYTAPA